MNCLKPGGKILVTLCRGQGGTPMDQPLRNWSDSWQIVSLAAYAGLVLHHIQAFDPNDYPQYSCTGYR